MFGADSADLVLRAPQGASDDTQVLRDTQGVTDQAGLVPRCCAQLLDSIRRRRELLGSEYSAVLHVAYVQVFGDEVTDLLYCPAPSGADQEEPDSAPVMTLNAAQTVLSGALDRQVHQRTANLIHLL